PTHTCTLSLHDALPIFKEKHNLAILSPDEIVLDDTDSPDTLTPLNTDFSFLISTMTDEIESFLCDFKIPEHLINTLTHASPIKTDRKSTRLNSSHVKIS